MNKELRFAWCLFCDVVTFMSHLCLSMLLLLFGLLCSQLERERSERKKRERMLKDQKEESSKDDKWLKQSERHSKYSVSAQVAAQLVEKAIIDKQAGAMVEVSYCV